MVTVAMLLFCLLPGFLFRRSLFVSEWGFLNEENFYEEFLWTIPTSLLFYLISIIVLNGIIFRILPLDAIDIKLVISLLSGEFKEDVLASINSHFGRISFYFIAINILASFLGGFLQRLIIRNDLDLKWNINLYTSPWYQLLSGRQEMYNQGVSSNGYYVSATVLCSYGDYMVLYRGNVADYSLGKEEKINYISLELAEKSFKTSPPYSWEQLTDILVIQNPEIKNILISYNEVPKPDIIQDPPEPTSDVAAEIPPTDASQ